MASQGERPGLGLPYPRLLSSQPGPCCFSALDSKKKLQDFASTVELLEEGEQEEVPEGNEGPDPAVRRRQLLMTNWKDQEQASAGAGRLVVDLDNQATFGVNLERSRRSLIR